MVMELKDQAGREKFSCLDAVTAELHHWTMELITGEDHELQLSDLGISIFLYLRSLDLSDLTDLFFVQVWQAAKPPRRAGSERERSPGKCGR